MHCEDKLNKTMNHIKLKKTKTFHTSNSVSKNTKRKKVLNYKKVNKFYKAKSDECQDFFKIMKNKNQSLKSLAVDELTTNGEINKEILNIRSNGNINPIEESENLFKWLIYPLEKNEFFKKNWESIPLHIKRNKSKYYKSLMSTPMLDQILRNNYIFFTKNIDITSFTNDKRETHNPPGRALPSVVWDYFLNGCSVRLLNPQTFIPKLHALNAMLQEFFGCFVGSNSYLTPPNSQGFAPHYDDIEAFILQIEGKKRWRLYKPRTEIEFLPRYSSSNFSQEDLGEPILDTVLNAGDILYFPRGTIHQGDTFGYHEHSLHITLSVYQRNSWGDFFEKLLPLSLNNAIKNDSRFRQGLPIHFLRYIGSTYENNLDCPKRLEFLSRVKSLLSILLSQYIDIDNAADETAINHIHDYLPPVLNKLERHCSVYDGGEKMIEGGIVINRIEITRNTLIRLCRGHSSRLVNENNLYRLYYSSENSKEYHQYEPQFLEVDSEFVPAIKILFIKYPSYIKVDDLPIFDLDKKIQLVQDLWEKSIVISQEPLFLNNLNNY